MINATAVGYEYAGRASHAYLLDLGPQIWLQVIPTLIADAQPNVARDGPRSIIDPHIDAHSPHERVDRVVKSEEMLRSMQVYAQVCAVTVKMTAIGERMWQGG